MSSRLRKLVGSLAILVFLALYVSGAVLLADHLPPGRIVQFAYFAAVGILWGAPLAPLIWWMNRGR